jgi:hypothetical protein
MFPSPFATIALKIFLCQSIMSANLDEVRSSQFEGEAIKALD